MFERPAPPDPHAEVVASRPLVEVPDLGPNPQRVKAFPRQNIKIRQESRVIVRYGIQTINYGTSSGLPDAELGENLAVDGLVRTAEVYARAATKVCEVVA